MTRHQLSDVLPKWARPGAPMVSGIGAVLLVGCVAGSTSIAHAEDTHEPRADAGPGLAGFPTLLVVGTPLIGSTLAVAIPTDRDLWLLLGLLVATALATLFYLAAHRHMAAQRSRRDPPPPDKRRLPEV